MAKAELGTKRQCHSCNTRFYDLNRDPILCPKCGAVFQLQESRPTLQGTGEAVVDEDTKAEPAAGPELVSLEEADATTAEKVLVPDEDVETAEETTDDETFLEEEEEGDDDVSALIDGDIEDDEEA